MQPLRIINRSQWLPDEEENHNHVKRFYSCKSSGLNETIAAELFEGKTYPWEVLPEISDLL